ncbi:hypothetical protein HDU83_002789 [Entophlyctis luteolus]|nr:hypothetical protein HDU83_002789 [Entophlyctis luteolus]KAJ3385568.1 hypothetical protein HDU84_002164 [Entophlyctis sp. JEL0112]
MPPSRKIITSANSASYPAYPQLQNLENIIGNGAASALSSESTGSGGVEWKNPQNSVPFLVGGVVVVVVGALLFINLSSKFNNNPKNSNDPNELDRKLPDLVPTKRVSGEDWDDSVHRITKTAVLSDPEIFSDQKQRDFEEIKQHCDLELEEVNPVKRGKSMEIVVNEQDHKVAPKQDFATKSLRSSMRNSRVGLQRQALSAVLSSSKTDPRNGSLTVSAHRWSVGGGINSAGRNSQYSKTGEDQGSSSQTSRTSVSVVSAKVQHYRVEKDWVPQQSDELELKEGDIVHVYQMYNDSWCEGFVERAGGDMDGFFPQECLSVEPLSLWELRAVEEGTARVDVDATEVVEAETWGAAEPVAPRD